MTDDPGDMQKILPLGAKTGSGLAPPGRLRAPSWITGEPVVEHTVEVDVPVSRAYERLLLWGAVPSFVEGVVEVRQDDSKRLHWVADTGGRRTEWDAEIAAIPNQRIEWREIGQGSMSGEFALEPIGSSRAKVTLRLNSGGLALEPDEDALQKFVEGS